MLWVLVYFVFSVMRVRAVDILAMIDQNMMAGVTVKSVWPKNWKFHPGLWSSGFYVGCLRPIPPESPE